MLHARPNDTGMSRVVQAIKHIDRLLYQEVFLILGFPLKQIQTNRIIKIAWIKVDDIFNTIFRYVCQHILYKVTVWINQGKTFAAMHILVRQVRDKPRLTDTSLTNHVRMAAAVIIAQANLFLHPTELIDAKQQPFVHQISRAINLFIHLALYFRRRNAILLWQMEDRCKFYTI